MDDGFVPTARFASANSAIVGILLENDSGSITLVAANRSGSCWRRTASAKEVVSASWTSARGDEAGALRRSMQKQDATWAVSAQVEGEHLVVVGRQLQETKLRIKLWEVRLAASEPFATWRTLAAGAGLLIAKVEALAEEKDRLENTCRVQERTIQVLSDERDRRDADLFRAFHHTLNYHKARFEQERAKNEEARRSRPIFSDDDETDDNDEPELMVMENETRVKLQDLGRPDPGDETAILLTPSKQRDQQRAPCGWRACWLRRRAQSSRRPRRVRWPRTTTSRSVPASRSERRSATTFARKSHLDHAPHRPWRRSPRQRTTTMSLSSTRGIILSIHTWGGTDGPSLMRRVSAGP